MGRLDANGRCRQRQAGLPAGAGDRVKNGTGNGAGRMPGSGTVRALRAFALAGAVLVQLHAQASSSASSSASSHASSHTESQANSRAEFHADFFRAAQIDGARTVADLLRRGMDPNLALNERGETGMILALREGSMRVFEVLLNASGINLEARASNGDTAMMMASYLGNQPAVEALLAKGAVVNRAGWTALHYAAAAGADGIVRLLLAHSAQVDSESPNGTTPLMMAALGGHLPAVKLLLAAGAKPDRKNQVGMDAAAMAGMNNHQEIVQTVASAARKRGSGGTP